MNGDGKLVHLVGGPMHGQEMVAPGYQLVVLRQDPPNAVQKYDGLVVQRIEGAYRFERVPGEVRDGSLGLYVGIWMGWER